VSSIYTLFFYGWTIITVFFYAWADFSKGAITAYYSIVLLPLAFMMEKLLNSEDKKIREIAALLFSVFILFPGFFWIRYYCSHFTFLGHVFPITPIGFLWHSIFALTILLKVFRRR